MEKTEYVAREISCSTVPIVFEETLCVGCGRCAQVCQVDVLIPSSEPGKPPVVLYPGECYYCGCCVMECPQKGAIRLRHPLMNQTKFVDIP